MFNKNVNTLWLDLDGVIADFNKSAIEIMGMMPKVYEKTHGTGKFWKAINSKPNFFFDLEKMMDADELYDNVKHLNPIILTGIPANMNEFSNQKVEWVKKHFGSDQQIICCKAREKSKFCKPGDILVDDRTIFKHLWENAGGIYVTHFNSKQSLDELLFYGAIDKVR
jgi:5'(3')-deoxyribonucleotidase